MKRTFQLIIVTLAFVFIYELSFSQVTKVDAIGITVKEMNRSVKFFTEVLGFKKLSDKELEGKDIENLEGVFGLHIRVVRMQLGDEFIELTDYLTTGGRSIPEDQKSNDLSFQHIAIVVSDMDKAYAQLRKFNVGYVSTAPQTLPKSIPGAEGIKAFYFHDPDNHNLELIFFPKGKGQAKWQGSTQKIFLGIDHTAIGVSNTESSHHFYNELLGIERKGDSWNKGNEQEHLNNVEGASLHITGYRTAAGPGVEFLQYLQPGPGKPYPADTKADDIWYWQTALMTDDAEAIYNKLKTAGYQFVSKELVKQPGSKSFIVKDPDGHAMMIKEVMQ
jgi:catechol 2,3-dioxygenase-like lactoylglutathione lyase family enzyme